MEIKLAEDTISNNDLNQLADWLRAHPKLTKGDLTLKLEAEFARLIGTKYSVFVNSGSSANLLMLASLIQRGICKFNKKVVVPAVSWATDLAPVIQLGLEPILIDCNLQNLAVDVDKLEEIFKTEEPAALLLVSVLGLPPDMQKIVSLCNKYHVVLIEDNCESLLTKYNGNNLGTFGTMSSFSTYYGHHMSTVEGGFITTNSEEYYNLLVMLRSHGWSRDCTPSKKKELKSRFRFSDFEEMYKFYIPAFNVRNTEIGAFLGIMQLNHLQEKVDIRKENFNRWCNGVKDFIWTPRIDSSHVVSSFALPIISTNRNKLVDEFTKHKIEVRPLVAGSMLSQPFYRKRDRDTPQKFGNSSLVNNFGMYLPNHGGITFDDIDKMIKIVRNVCVPV